jgi:hypothetical protein
MAKTKAVTKQVQATAVALSVNQVVEGLRKKASPLLRKASMDVVEKSDYDKLGEVVSQLKEYRKEADVQEKSLTEPANQIIKNAKAIFKPFKDGVDEAERLAKQKMLAFLEAQEAAAKRIQEKFERGDIKKISTVVAKTNELLDTQSESVSVRKIQVLKIVDVNKIPREFLVPNEALIKQALKEGRKVAGCELEYQKSLAI